MLNSPSTSELNFPTGPKLPLELKELRWELPMFLMDAVFYCTRGRLTNRAVMTPEMEAALAAVSKAVAKGVRSRAVMLVPHVVVLRPDFYFSDLKDPLASWLLQFLLRRRDVRTTLGERTADGHLCVTEEVVVALRNYIKGARTNSISAMYLGQRCGSELLKILNLCRDWINVFLPHCLAKIDRVSYVVACHARLWVVRVPQPCLTSWLLLALWPVLCCWTGPGMACCAMQTSAKPRSPSQLLAPSTSHALGWSSRCRSSGRMSPPRAQSLPTRTC